MKPQHKAIQGSVVALMLLLAVTLAASGCMSGTQATATKQEEDEFRHPLLKAPAGASAGPPASAAKGGQPPATSKS